MIVYKENQITILYLVVLFWGFRFLDWRFKLLLDNGNFASLPAHCALTFLGWFLGSGRGNWILID
jgi:hypothetical protein